LKLDDCGSGSLPPPRCVLQSSHASTAISSQCPLARKLCQDFLKLWFCLTREENDVSSFFLVQIATGSQKNELTPFCTILATQLTPLFPAHSDHVSSLCKCAEPSGARTVLPNRPRPQRHETIAQARRIRFWFLARAALRVAVEALLDRLKDLMPVWGSADRPPYRLCEKSVR
jgi:hypothetical protein